MTGQQKRSMTDPEKKTNDTDAADQELPILMGRLGDDIMTLLDSKLGLLKIEIAEELNAYVRDGVAIGVGGIFAVIGLALLSVAVSFLVASQFGDLGLSPPVRHALAFLVTAFLCLAVGSAIVIRATMRWGRKGLIPVRSLRELVKDRRWLGRQL